MLTPGGYRRDRDGADLAPAFGSLRSCRPRAAPQGHPDPLPAGRRSRDRVDGLSQRDPGEDTVNWQGIQITRTPCQHGTGAVLGEMGDASGFVFEVENEPTVYWAGDTIWCEPVAETIHRTQPDVIITHSCGAMWGDHVLIVMDAAQTVAVCRAAPNSTVIATHMEALDHATVTRAALRKYAETQGVEPGKLLIPLDGEKVVF